MTQMGLDYQKHLENKRHNLLTEGISQQDADTRKREADTHAKQADTQEYLASFKEREVSASEKQATASESQAVSAAKKADQYSRELDIKQKAVDATNRGNTLKYLDSSYVGNPLVGRMTTALAFLLGEGLITKDESNLIHKVLMDNPSVEAKAKENAEKFRRGETTAWGNTMASFR